MTVTNRIKYKLPISVVMPCFNGENYITMAIESILNQSFGHFELIIINDGSTDRTHSEIMKFSDNRIKYIQNDENKGNYSSRNLGISQSFGKYICMMDADDIAYDDRLQVQYEYMEEQPGIGAVGSLSHVIDEKSKIVGHIERPLTFLNLKVKLLIDLTQSTLMMRSCLVKENLLYDDSFKYAGDYDFVVRFSKKHKIVNLNQYLVQYRLHPDQISSKKYDEQMEFADKVRMDQLKEFDVDICEEERFLHLKLVHSQYLSIEELLNAEVWLNKLLTKNSTLKIYNQELLYQLFAKLIEDAAAINLAF
jgi:glycosyltransferase involved in cell wall biosynthesis